MWLLLTVAASATGGYLLFKAKFPGGVIVGAILGSAILNVATGQAFMFSQAQTIAAPILSHSTARRASHPKECNSSLHHAKDRLRKIP